ncbi:MAG: hypothetical protein AAGL69_06040 [Pseudomonadota bacterium]
MTNRNPAAFFWKPLRTLIALGIAFAVVVYHPKYGEPFGGCEASGYLSLVPGCTYWYEFIAACGVCIVLGLVAPNQYKLHIAALLILVFIALIGGLEERMNGSAADYFASASFWDQIRTLVFHRPSIHGAIVGVVLVNLIRRRWRLIANVPVNEQPSAIGFD